ncbi:hypothetical protein HMPREF3293_00319 [Christensenella minuta]|uniref:Uncharacterized protein n=1 Tax=Christensenella minuta TaxID=626937 RepID=A0A136Q7X1_9FIRM|nr:hypothetical protein HMPREF3293_00319 [Christensenella minuta]
MRTEPAVYLERKPQDYKIREGKRIRVSLLYILRRTVRGLPPSR